MISIKNFIFRTSDIKNDDSTTELDNDTTEAEDTLCIKIVEEYYSDEFEENSDGDKVIFIFKL